MNEKILSIYIPTYNRAEKVVRQLEFLLSELNELNEEDKAMIEIIVNNNCSTDDTEEKVLDVISETLVKYHKNSTNLGIVGNVYKAINFVQGKYLWIVSDDDTLQKGILQRIIGIFKSYPTIGYIFLNYSDSVNANMGQYDGPEGMLVDGVTALLIPQFVHNLPHLVLTTSSIYLKECFAEAINNLPFETQEMYGWSGYTSLTALKRGNSFFDGKVWVNCGNGKSWEDIECEAYKGAVRALSKLNLVGYSKKEITQIIKNWIEAIRILDILVYCKLWKCSNYGQFFSDYIFYLGRAPQYIVKRSFKLVGKLLHKMKSGRLTWDK